MKLLKDSFLIKNKLGLHARAAAKFVNIVTKYKSEVTVIKDDKKVNGKSIMSLIMLTALLDDTIEVSVQGDDAGECIKDLEMLVDNKFGED